MIYRVMVCIAAAALIAGCGQKASTRTGAPISPAPIASAPGTTQSSSQRKAVPAASVAPVPSGMSCKDGAEPVWINERTKVYHVAGDPYYGRTKHGRYLCERDAKREGYRSARAHT